MLFRSQCTARCISCTCARNSSTTFTPPTGEVRRTSRRKLRRVRELPRERYLTSRRHRERRKRARLERRKRARLERQAGRRVGSPSLLKLYRNDVVTHIICLQHNFTKWRCTMTSRRRLSSCLPEQSWLFRARRRVPCDSRPLAAFAPTRMDKRKSTRKSHPSSYR